MRPLMQLRLVVLFAFTALIVGCTTPATVDRPLLRGEMFDVSSAFSPRDWERRFILVTLTEDAYTRLLEVPAMSDGELPVNYADFVGELRHRFALQRIADWPLATLGIRCLVFERLGDTDDATILAKLRGDPRVESAQVMGRFSALQAQTGDSYSDPYLELQHAYALMDVAAAHRYATGKGVRVAVIDTGVDVRHLDIAQSVELVRNHVNKDEDTFRTDIHGTAIAGIIAAGTDDAIGIAGVAPDVSLLALKACWPQRIGDRSASCNSYTVAKALNFAIAQGVDIINLSLGGPADPLLNRLIDKALADGTIVVASLHPTDPSGFAGGVNGVIVASDDPAAKLPAGLLGRTVSAPGVNVLSARPGDQYDFFDGSSVSTAHVTGVLALMRERRPHLTSALALAALSRAGSTPARHVPSVSACTSVAAVVSGAQCPRNAAHD